MSAKSRARGYLAQAYKVAARSSPALVAMFLVIFSQIKDEAAFCSGSKIQI
jgi:hypothetical protein